MQQMALYKKLLWYTVITIWMLLILHLGAMKFYLYWLLDWFDILMHGLGGVAVGLFLAAILIRIKPMLRQHPGLLIFLIVAGTVFVGVLWESLEFVLDVYMKAPIHQPSVSDTIMDLVMDTVGAFVASILASIIMKRYVKD